MTDKPKTFQRKELEKIAQQLKNKLSKASITAKQTNGLTVTSSGRSTAAGVNSIISPIKGDSPLKALRRPLDSSPISHTNNGLSSSPQNNLYSPIRKSPTHMKTQPAIFLSLSPLKNVVHEEQGESPLKRRKHNKLDPQMILEEISRPNTPSRVVNGSLKPSIDLSKKEESKENDDEEPEEQTTPVLTKANMNDVLKTPTSKDSNYEDEEGADLLMYLATSPSPAKPMFVNTPRASALLKDRNFVQPHPMTPKRPNIHTNKTPQNRLTPSMNLFLQATNNNGHGLPSSGLTLTPTGFNMNDYVNFFTPSPGVVGAPGTAQAQAQAQAIAQAHALAQAQGHHSNSQVQSMLTRNLLRTPDFNNFVNSQTPGRKVDGKLLNFNRVLFNNSDTPKE